jgi:glycosyltransferase involved in cell wall biosynthesis
LTGKHKERLRNTDSGELQILYAYAMPDLHKNFIWRVLSFFSFMFSSIRPGLKAGGIDLVMGTSPPIFQAWSAWIISVLRHKPFVLEIRDLWPEFAVDMGVLRNKGLIWFSRRLEMFLYRRAVHIIVNSPAYIDYLAAKKISPQKVTLVANGTDSAMFAVAPNGRSFRKKWHLEEKFLVVYAGAVGPANDLDTLLLAAALLKSENKLHFLIVGDGKERERLLNQAMELGLQNVTFAGTILRLEMPALLAECDACVAILKNIPMFRMTYPNKVFDYMASGRPTVLAIDGVIRKVLEEARAGLYVPPGSAQAIADAVRYLFSHPREAMAMGTSARLYVQSHFERRDQAERLRDVLKNVIQAQ